MNRSDKGSKNLILIISLFLLGASTLSAGDTGKIAGKIVDAQTGEPLVAANVIVSSRWIGDEEIRLSEPSGAATDEQGRYFILRLKPGLYMVGVSYIGYRPEEKTHVRVNIDKTTQINFSLESIALQGEEVLVSAYRPTEVDADQTATRQLYFTSDYEHIAGMSDVSDLIDLQADVSAGHFRGGRSAETAYIIEGVSIVIPLNDSPAFSPMTIAFEQVEVYTSGFSAQYGNAMSGVVNMVQKEGGDKWGLQAEISSTLPHARTWARGGTYYSEENIPFHDDFLNTEEWTEINPAGEERNYGVWERYLPPWFIATREDTLQIAEMKKAQYLSTFRDMGLETQSRIDYRADLITDGPVTENMRVFIALRQEVEHPELPVLIPDMNRQLMGNLTYKPSPNNKLMLSYIYNRDFTNAVGTETRSAFLNGRIEYTDFRTSTTNSYRLAWEHVFSASTFIDWQISVLNTLFEERPAWRDPGDYSHALDNLFYKADSWPFAARPGQHLGDFRTERTYTYAISGGITSQINMNHLLNTGMYLAWYNLDVHNEYDIDDGIGMTIQDFQAQPYEGAFYVEDKLEYEGIIANLGVRIEFLDLNTTYYTDIYSPFRNPEFDATLPYYLQSDYYDNAKALTAAAEPYIHMQPRIGISFPISTRSAVRLNYGTFTQRADFERIYWNFVTKSGLLKQMGNPRLEPERTIMYDIGLVQIWPWNLEFEVSAFYKDVRNLLETAIYIDEKDAAYVTYQNRDYANIKGFGVNLIRRTGMVTALVRYNWQYSKGKSSTYFNAPVTHLEAPREGQEAVQLPDPEDIFMDFDRRHTAVVNLSLNTPSKMWPSIGSFSPFGGLQISGTFRLETGRPYTYDELGLGLKMNKRTPTERELRMRVQKWLKFGSTKMRVYFEGFNLLNDKHYHYTRIFGEPEQERGMKTRWEIAKEEGLDPSTIMIDNEHGAYGHRLESRLISNKPRYFRAGVKFYF